MRILILQDIPLKTPQEKFSIAKCFERSFYRAGHSAMAIDTRNYRREDIIPLFSSFDVLLITQNYFLQYIEYVHEFKGLKIFWSIDSHKDLETHKKFIENNKIDITLVSSYNHVEKFDNAFWFPNCYPSDLISPTIFKDRPIQVGFCGSQSNRGDWLTKLSTEFNFHLAINEVAESMVNNLTSFGISWNRNEADDLNFRTFESAGAGALLITNKTPGLEFCFDTIDIELYETIEECIDKIKYYRDNESDRLRIAMNGYVRARNNHSFDSRVTELIKIIETGSI